MVDHICEIPKLVDFCVKCFNCADTRKLCERNNPAWDVDDIYLIPMLIGTPCTIIKKLTLQFFNKVREDLNYCYI